MSNTTGGNTTTDKIQFSIHNQNPSDASDTVAAINVSVNQVAQQGSDPLTPIPMWYSGWSGVPSVQSIPGIASETGDPISAVWNGRVYIMFAGQADCNWGSGNVYSAQLVAGGVGQWRRENGLGPSGNWFTFPSGVTRYVAGANQMAVCANWLYACVNCMSVLSQPSATQPAVILAAPIGGDGRLGQWVFMSQVPYNLRSEASMVIGRPNFQGMSGGAAGNLFVMGGWLNTVGTTAQVWSCYVWNDGSLQGQSSAGTTTGWFTQQAMPFSWRNTCIYYDNNFPHIYIFGGDDASNQTGDGQTGILDGSLNDTDTLSWGVNVSHIPAGRTKGALVAVLDNNFSTRFYYMGGAAGYHTTHSTAIYTNSLNGPGSFASTGWTTLALTLPSVPATQNGGFAPLLCAFSGSTPGSTEVGNQFFSPGSVPQGSALQGAVNVTARVGDSGGVSGSGASNTATQALPWICYMYHGSSTFACSPLDNSPSWRTGNAPGLAVADIGGSLATITNNSDGTQDVTITYRGWGGVQSLNGNPAYNGGIGGANGNRLQVSVQTMSIKGGVSPVAFSEIYIGQGPTISSLAASSTANGQPQVTFRYNAGAGGGPERTWRVLLTRNSDSAVMFDTGLRYDGSNAANVVCAPVLVTATAYTITCQITSSDDVMAGSFNSAQTTLGLTPALGTVPLTPTGVSVTADNDLGRFLLRWTNPVGGTAVSYNRIYYRHTGDTPWNLYADRYTPLAQGSQNTAFIADGIRLLTGFDFAVSSLSAANVEGSKSSTVSGTVVPTLSDAGLSVAFLHEMGKLDGTARVAQIKAFGDPGIQAEFTQGSASTGAATVPLMGAALPIRRYGPQNARTMTVNIIAVDDAAYRSLVNLINYSLTGVTLFYRDRLAQFAVAIGDSNKLTWDSGYRKSALELVQVADVSRPFVTQGTALGVATLNAGNLPPYDPVEVP